MLHLAQRLSSPRRPHNRPREIRCGHEQRGMDDVERGVQRRLVPRDEDQHGVVRTPGQLTPEPPGRADAADDAHGGPPINGRPHDRRAPDDSRESEVVDWVVCSVSACRDNPIAADLVLDSVLADVRASSHAANSLS